MMSALVVYRFCVVSWVACLLLMGSLCPVVSAEEAEPFRLLLDASQASPAAVRVTNESRLETEPLPQLDLATSLTNAESADLQSPNAPTESAAPGDGNQERVSLTNEVTRFVLEAQRSLLILQDQLRSSMLAMEEARLESDQAAQQRASLLSHRLGTLEEALLDQRQINRDLIQQSNRSLILIAGSFAGVLVLLALVIAWFQWRSLNQLTAIAMTNRNALPLARPVLQTGNGGPVVASAMSESSQKLLGALEHLDQRIQEMERAATASQKSGSLSSSYLDSSVPPPLPSSLNTSDNPEARPVPSQDASEEKEISLTLGKGQSLLNAGRIEEAMDYFNEVISREPKHAEALMKKGIALERQERYREALDCYDRAIQANRSLTLAYLHKGGVFNQLDRFDEALQCYEQALKLQQMAEQQNPSAFQV